MMFTRVCDFKRKVIIVWIVIVVLVGTSIYFLVNAKSKLLKVKGKVITVEYGQSVSLDPKFYLNVSDLNASDKDDVLKNTKLKSNVKNEIEIINNVDGTKSERDKGYAAVGTYKVILKYKDEIKEVKVVVKDTTKPELIVPGNVEILLGTDLNTFDFKKLMQSTDLANLNDYIIDTSTVDVNKIGEYSVKVSIEDVNKNKSEKEFKVIVILPPASDEEVIQEVVTNDDGTKSVKVITKKKAVSSKNESSSSVTSSKPSNNTKPIDKPSTGSTGNDSNGSSSENDANNSQNNNNGDKNNGHYVYIYYCLLHSSQTYSSLDDLISSGHYTIRANGSKFAGCNGEGYGEGEEWIKN